MLRDTTPHTREVSRRSVQPFLGSKTPRAWGRGCDPLSELTRATTAFITAHSTTLKGRAMIKALTLLIVLAVVALGGSMPATATAATEFHSENAPAYLHGTQVEANLFTINGRTIECHNATYSGTQNTLATSQLTLTPTLWECDAFGLAMTFTPNGCDFQLTVDDSEGPYTGAMHIACTGEDRIEMMTSHCTIEISAQTPAGSVDYQNQGAEAGRDILVTWTIDLQAQMTGPKLLCGTNGTRTMTLRGTTTLKGFTTSGYTTQIGIWVE